MIPADLAEGAPDPGLCLLDGLNLFVRDEGSGPPVLLLHDFPFSHHTYRAVLEPLAKKNRTLAIDLPGFGDSDRPPAFKYDPVSCADSMAGVIAELGAKPAAVVAHGFGAAIALGMAVLEPGTVRRLVLVGANVYPQPLPFLLRWAMDDGMLKPWLLRLAFTRQRLARYMRERAYSAPGIADDTLVDYFWERVAREGGREALRRAVVAVDNLDPVAELPPRVTCPTLVVWGDRDRIVPPAFSRRLADEIPNAKGVEIASSGHSPQEEQPARFLDVVLPFLEGER